MMELIIRFSVDSSSVQSHASESISRFHVDVRQLTYVPLCIRRELVCRPTTSVVSNAWIQVVETSERGRIRMVRDVMCT